MPDFPNVIGYELNKAKTLLGDSKHISIEKTLTPYEDKRLEREANVFVVVRQRESQEEIILTVSQFM